MRSLAAIGMLLAVLPILFVRSDPVAAVPLPLDMRYDTYVPSGPLTAPGSYRFLTADGVGIQTYDAARQQADMLHLHIQDTGHTDQSARLDLLTDGDLVEWWHADDCFVRYLIGGSPIVDAASRLIPIQWTLTYAHSGCDGSIRTGILAHMRLGDRPDLGGRTLRVPIVHGRWQIVPADWDGELLPMERITLPARGDGRSADTIEEARSVILFWRTPVIPEPWEFGYASNDPEATPYGYEAVWHGEPRYETIVILGGFLWGRLGIFPARDRAWSVAETRVIAGRPAVLELTGSYSQIILYDAATDHIAYQIRSHHRYFRSSSGIDDLIAIARSLFELPNPP